MTVTVGAGGQAVGGETGSKVVGITVTEEMGVAVLVLGVGRVRGGRVGVMIGVVMIVVGVGWE